jgi:hypothetical protein
MKTESESVIPFLCVLVFRKETNLASKGYRKPIYTGRGLNFKPIHPPHVKRSSIQSIHNKVSIICQEGRDLFIEISSLRSDLQPNGSPQGYIDTVINSEGNSRMNKEEKPLDSCVYPICVGVSEKFKRMGKRYNIRTIFRTKHTLRSSFMKTRLERDPQRKAQCIYTIPMNATEATLAKQADH